MKLTNLPPAGLIVALNGYVRLCWKGEPPHVPFQVSDMNSVLWTSSVDYARKIVRVEKRTNAYAPMGEGRQITVYLLSPEDFEKVKVPTDIEEPAIA